MRSLFALLLAGLSLCAQEPAAPAKRAIDPAKSRLTVYAYKTGFLSFAAHDHEIAAPIVSGHVQESGAQSVELVIDARQMKVLDPKLAAEKRAEVQKTMLSATVLDVEKFPEIRFVSTKVAANGKDQWNVLGNLTLHGQTKQVAVVVSKQGERYLGSAKFKQTDFGIAPVSVAGGTIKVKDEVKIEFEIVLK
ncbi:MAG: YceI family protein [Acidobacteriales bacterium]|nr:YceI family protein [Terriglobales bacterium]